METREKYFLGKLLKKLIEIGIGYGNDLSMSLLEGRAHPSVRMDFRKYELSMGTLCHDLGKC